MATRVMRTGESRHIADLTSQNAVTLNIDAVVATSNSKSFLRRQQQSRISFLFVSAGSEQLRCAD